MPTQCILSSNEWTISTTYKILDESHKHNTKWKKSSTQEWLDVWLQLHKVINWWNKTSASDHVAVTGAEQACHKNNEHLQKI